MPTFNVVALDRLLDQPTSKSTPSTSTEPPSTPSSSSLNDGDARSTSMRPAPSLSRRNSMPPETERRGRGRSAQLPPISPALYVTSETMRLSDSPVADSESQSDDLVR